MWKSFTFTTLFLFLSEHEVASFSTKQLNVLPQINQSKPLSSSNHHSLNVLHAEQNGNSQVNNHNNQRREFLFNTLSVTASVLATSFPTPSNAVERAVGGSEKLCREEGNCLEKGELDGAVGWSWGGKDRCDATDPRCGPDGSLKDAPPAGQPVPKLINDEGNTLKITNIIDIDISIGRTEQGTLSIGLYGDACPYSVSQITDFLSDNIYSGGLLTTSKLMLEDGLGVQTTPVSFIRGGNLQTIYPQTRLDFGVASQGFAYAKTKRLSKVPDGFLAQPRPTKSKEDITNEKTARSHSVAGLVSIPKSGLGYGGTGLESDDEAFASSFEISATSVPAMDKESRKVIGQLIDDDSMQFLQRLASLPTNKGMKGVIPGQNAGPPLIKVSVTSVSSPPSSGTAE